MMSVMNLLLWQCVWERYMTLSTRNITPFTTYHMVGARGDVWWLHFIDCCPTHSGQVGDQHALQTHAGAQRIRDDLDFFRITAATKSPLHCHRYIVSVIIAWCRRICVGVNIWGGFWWCQMCRIYMYCVHVVILLYPLIFRPRRPQKWIQHKILG